MRTGRFSVERTSARCIRVGDLSQVDTFRSYIEASWTEWLELISLLLREGGVEEIPRGVDPDLDAAVDQVTREEFDQALHDAGIPSGGRAQAQKRLLNVIESIGRRVRENRLARESGHSPTEPGPPPSDGGPPGE